MNKTANCIKMLNILYGVKKISIAELASLLETNPRNVIEYKKELENAGYIIDSSTGKYGGYSLLKTRLLPQVALTQDEKFVIFNAFEYLRKDKCFLKNTIFDEAVGKLCSSFINVGKNFANQIDIYQRFPIIKDQSSIVNFTNIINMSIMNKNKLEILYLSKDNTESKHIIEPYKIYLYADSWFVLANNPAYHKVLYYKICRINDIKTLNEKFRIPFDFNIKDYLDEFGMTKNGDWINIKFLLKNNAYTMAKERMYAKEQKITELDKNSCILEGKMQDKELLSFILSWGTNCEVLEPIELREKVKEEIKNLTNQYDI